MSFRAPPHVALNEVKGLTRIGLVDTVNVNVTTGAIAGKILRRAFALLEDDTGNGTPDSGMTQIMYGTQKQMSFWSISEESYKRCAR